MKFKKSNVIKKPFFPLYLLTCFLVIMGIAVLIVGIFNNEVTDVIRKLNPFLINSTDSQLELAAVEYYESDHTADDDNKIKYAEAISIVDRNSMIYKIKGETVVDTYQKLSIIYFNRDNEDNIEIMYSVRSWDESKYDIYREMSEYASMIHDSINAYGFTVLDLYYNPESKEVYPGKIGLSKYSVFDAITNRAFYDESTFVLEYDLTPDDTTNLIHVQEPSALFGISEEAPTSESITYEEYINKSWQPVEIYCDHTCADAITKYTYVLIITAAVIIVLLVSVVLATILYFNKKNIYNIFEYRKKTTNAMAHDLKTPLAIASLYVANLKENLSDPSKSEKHANEIDDSISYMNKLVNSILEFSNSESDTAIKKESLDIRTEINNYISSIEANLQSRQLSVAISGDAKITTDKKLWNQAITNLIDNAIKYTSAPSIDINITDKEVSISNSVESDISNVSDLKEPFVKGDSERGENTGSGLGLSIADNNLKHLGYKLDVNCVNKKFIAKIKM